MGASTYSTAISLQASYPYVYCTTIVPTINQQQQLWPSVALLLRERET